MAAALATALVPAAGNAVGCEDAPDAETLHMTVRVDKSEVAPGGTVELLVTVARGIDGDDRPRIPASDVRSIVTLNSTWPYMAGEATTASDGSALVEISVPKKAPPGWLDGYGVAQVEHGPRLCGDTVAERGYWTGTRIVKVGR